MSSLKDLVESVLSWWKEHEYDVDVSDEGERNTYSGEPEFVKMAKSIQEHNETAGWNDYIGGEHDEEKN